MVFNATNVHITVNGNWLNDAMSISWQQQSNPEPLFGYMDDRYRVVTRSTSLVAGTIGIYYKTHDLFFRYIAGTIVAPSVEATQKIIDAEVHEAIRQGNLISLLGNLDLTSREFDLYRKATFDAYGLSNIKIGAVQTSTVDSDVVGRSGWEVTNRKSPTRDQWNQPVSGSVIDIYYGDSSSEVETLYGVYIIGRAKSPIENGPRTGAEPLMEYYSFLANYFGRPARPKVNVPTSGK